MNLYEPIIPGSCAAGIRLGDSIEAILARHKPLTVHQLYPGASKYLFQGVSLWVTDGRIDQIGVRAPYGGKLPEGIGLGATIAQVEASIGAVMEDDYDNLVVRNSPGWCFETEESLEDSTAMPSSNARLVEIYIFDPNEMSDERALHAHSSAS